MLAVGVIVGSGISFSKKNIFGLLGAISFITAIILTIIAPILTNLMFQFSFFTDPKTIVHLIDTNIIIIIILGTVGGCVSYFSSYSSLKQ